MKNTLTAIALLISISSFAQVKAPEKKPEYKKFIKMEISDFQTCYRALQKWHDLAPFDSKVSDSEKVATYKDLEPFIAEFMKRVQVDSVMVVDSVAVKGKKK